MDNLSIPTTSALPSTQLLPNTHPLVTKTLHRLTRPSLLTLALDWLHAGNQEICPPYLLPPDGDDDDDDQDTYPPASSLSALQEIYTELQSKNGTKRDILERILEGDWRNGISLYQIAMADMQYLYDHPNSQKWSALKIVRLGGEEDQEREIDSVPRFHPSTFLRNLQQEVLPDVKAHYNLDRHTTLPLLILRIFVLESPYNTSLAFSEKQKHTSKTFYIAFPDFSPYVYVSLSTATGSAPGDSKSLRKLILDGIPKAFSKPRERYRLQSTNLAARNLEALVEKRGGGKTNAAGGAWAVYASEKYKEKDNPLNTKLPTPPAEDEEEDELSANIPHATKRKGIGMKRKREENSDVIKRRKLLAKARFGNSAKINDGKGIERMDVRIEDPFPSTASLELDEISTVDPKEKKKKGRRSDINVQLDRNSDENETEEGWRPDIRLTLNGSHIFAGLRELVEAGVVDGRNMPGWMTGEEGVSVGVVRDGRIKGFKGSRV